MHSHRKQNRRPHWHWGTALNTPPTTPTTPGRTGWPSKRRCTGQWMPQPRTTRCPRRGLHSRATWQPMCETSGQHRSSAGCPGPRTRSELSNFAAPAYKNTQTSFGVCTGHTRDRDRHTAYSAATHQSRLPNRHQNNPGPNRGPAHTYEVSSCFFPKFKVMHFQNGDIKLYTVVLLFLCYLTKLCCRWSWSRRSTVNNCRVREFQIPDRRAQ